MSRRAYRIARTLELIADEWLLHGQSKNPKATQFICAALDLLERHNLITDGHYKDVARWLAVLGMDDGIPFMELGYDGLSFYSGHALFATGQRDEEQSIRWAWLKFAAQLAREEARA